MALGHCNTFVGVGLSPWDTGAGPALVSAVGGTILRGSIPTGPSVIIAGGEDLLAFMAARIRARSRG